MPTITKPPVIQTLTLSRRVRVSAMYLIFFSAVAALAPYIVLYYRSLGFSGSQIGILLSIGPLISLVAAPMWTGYADSRNRHLAILLGALLGSSILYALFPFLQSFAWIFVAMMVIAVFTSPLVALLDSSTVFMLGEQKDRYGRIRLWGTVGWGITAPIAGEVLERYGLEWMFWIFAAFFFIDIFFARHQKFDTTSEHKPYWQGIRTLLSDQKWVLFLVGAFITTFGLQAHLTYLPLLLEEMDARHTILGISLTVSTIFEVPFLVFASYFLRRFGNRGLLFIAIGFTALRTLLYAVVGGPFLIIAIQVIHGLTYPALTIAGVNFADDNAPTGFKSTAQGVFGAVQGGLGTAAGNLVCGLLIDQVGVRGMFSWMGWMLVVSLAVLMLVNSRLNGSNPRYT